MIGTRFAGLLIAAGLFVPTLSTHAGDTFRLDMPAPAKATSGRPAADDDLQLVHLRGFHGGFYRPSYGYAGYRGAYYGGYYGGYRGAYYGYPRYYASSYYYRPYYAGYAYPSVYYSSYYYPRVYSYYSPISSCSLGTALPIMPPAVSLQLGAVPPSVSLRIGPSPGVVERVLDTPPATVLPPPGSTPGGPPPSALLPDGTPGGPPPGAGTFPYDGGPLNPIPMPKLDEIPTSAPSMVIRPEFRVISLAGSGTSEARPSEARAPESKAKGKWAYPAYGEEAKRSSFASDRPNR